jgi:hypothetical protein
MYKTARTKAAQGRTITEGFHNLCHISVALCHAANNCSISMRQGLVSQDIAAGNESFVEVFSHEALSGALHHDLRFGWHGSNCRPAPINVASFTGASPSRHTRSRDHKGLARRPGGGPWGYATGPLRPRTEGFQPRAARALYSTSVLTLAYPTIIALSPKPNRTKTPPGGLSGWTAR